MRALLGGLAIPAVAAQRTAPQTPVSRLEVIVCPNCDKTYQVDANSIGRSGRRVRCQRCGTYWFDVTATREDYEERSNPVLAIGFAHKLKLYLNGLPEQVKQDPAKTTHAIKLFLMRHGPADGATGHANGIRVDLAHFSNTQFLWDAVAKSASPAHPGEDYNLLFVAESEDHPQIDRIVERVNKLPVARADARMMFFRSSDQTELVYFFDRLHGLVQRHRKSLFGDVYILAGMDVETLNYRVRKLTLRRPGSNINPWEEF